MLNVDYPVIKSLLDNDLYKLTQGSVVFHLFPNARAKYSLILRRKVPFPKEFGNELEKQIILMSHLSLAREEAQWLKSIPYTRRTYVEWFSGYNFDPLEVEVFQKGNELELNIEGYWYRTIFWEVPLMALISELYFIMTGQLPTDGWELKIEDKTNRLSDTKCHWMEFGTRRRYSQKVQEEVVRQMKGANGFLGTSNMDLARRYGVTCRGTYAHEAISAMTALYGPRMANKMWNKHWAEHYNGNCGIALPDTLTTDVFLRDFGPYEARLFDGVRQDSGNPIEFANKMLDHYKKLGIQTENKRFVFSDNLNTEKYVFLDQSYRSHCQPIGGIGTHFTNDVGVTPLNMVIKLMAINFGSGYVNTIKLSDDPGKHTGDPETIRKIKEELNII